MWHNEGLYLWTIQPHFAGISPIRAFTFLSAHLLERRNYTHIRRVGVKGLLLLYSYFGSTGSFQRRGRGNWCVKINYRHKKIICQTACWSSLINLTFPSMFHEEAGISQLDKRWQLPGTEAVQQVGLAWAPIVCDGHADRPHHLPVLQCPQCTGSSPNTSDTVTGCEALSAVLCCSRAAIRNHAVHCIKIEIAALVQV